MARAGPGAGSAGCSTRRRGDRAFTLTPECYSAVGSAANLTWFDYDGEGTTIRFGDGTFGSARPGRPSSRSPTWAEAGSRGNVPADTIVRVDPGSPRSATSSRARTPSRPAAGRRGDRPADPRPRPQAFRDTAARRAAARLHRRGTVAALGTAGRHHIPLDGELADRVHHRGPDGDARSRRSAAARANDLLDRRRLAGYESYVLAPQYASLDLQITVVRATRRFRRRGRVRGAHAPAPRAAARRHPGFFDHSRWAFGAAGVERAAGRGAACGRLPASPRSLPRAWRPAGLGALPETVRRRLTGSCASTTTRAAPRPARYA